MASGLIYSMHFIMTIDLLRLSCSIDVETFCYSMAYSVCSKPLTEKVNRGEDNDSKGQRKGLMCQKESD